MKLLILTTQDRFFLSHVCERALYFQAQGWDVSVAVQVTNYAYAEKIKRLGFELFDTKIERQSVNPLLELVRICNLISIYRECMPDIVWHLGAKSIGYGTIVSLLLRAKYDVKIVNAPIGLGYVFSSNSLKARFLKPLVVMIYRFLLNPRNSKVIVENQDDIDFFIKIRALSRQDAHCILGAGVDTDEFKPSRQTSEIICTVMMASRLIAEKGVWDFVEAAEVLHKMKVPVRMILVGEPDYGNPSSLTKEEFNKLQTNPAIECWGFQSDMRKVLSQADIFCLPSYYREGLPKALVEAASCGLPILTTKTVGCKEVIRGDNGFALKPRDVNELVRHILLFVNDRELMISMGQRSRIVALELFDKKKICALTYMVFNKLL